MAFSTVYWHCLGRLRNEKIRGRIMTAPLQGRYLVRLGNVFCQTIKNRSLAWYTSSVWQRSFTPTLSFSSSAFLNSNERSTEKTVDISENPFFDKYKSKIQHMQNTNPEEYEDRLKDLQDKQKPEKSKPQAASKSSKQAEPPKVAPPSSAAQAGVGMTKSESLDSVLKLELVQNKTAEEVTQIWNQYHSTKDCVYTVLQASEYENLIEKSKECPVFVYPVRRDDGFEFILAQFDRHNVYFTPLAMFQLVRENAPPCLTLTHYTELLDDKGIVLMSGQYDDKVLSQQLALSLVQQMSIFYGRNSKFYDLVHRFNYQPETFEYQELIDALKTLPQYDMK